MSDNIHYLGNVENSAILTLEHVLEKARAGELNGLFIAATLKNGNVMGCSVLDEESPIFTILGLIEAGKNEIVAKIHGLTQDIDYSTEA